MKRTLAVLFLALAAVVAGCKGVPSEDEPVIEDQLAAKNAIDEADVLFTRGSFSRRTRSTSRAFACGSATRGARKSCAAR